MMLWGPLLVSGDIFFGGGEKGTKGNDPSTPTLNTKGKKAACPRSIQWSCIDALEVVARYSRTGKEVYRRQRRR